MHPDNFLLPKLPVAPGEALLHLPQHLLSYQSHDNPLSIMRRITCWFQEGGRPAQAQTRLTISKAEACVWQGAPCQHCQVKGCMELSLPKPLLIDLHAKWDRSTAGELGLGTATSSHRHARTLRILWGSLCHWGKGGEVAVPISSETLWVSGPWLDLEDRNFWPLTSTQTINCAGTMVPREEKSYYCIRHI